MKSKFLLATFSVLIFLSSCTNNGNKDKSFQEITQNIKITESIQIEPIDGLNNNRIGSDIWLSLKNNSNYIIQFPPNLNIEIWYFDNNKQNWIKVKNGVQYETISPIIFQPLSERQNVFIITPILDLNSEIEIRVLLYGQVLDNEDLQNVNIGNYLDVKLFP